MDFFKEDFFKEGAFGCVFRPGMNCLGEIEDIKYITKIQIDEETSDNEIKIGEFMETVIKKEMPTYEDMFAPIIESCKLSLGKIENETIKKCEVVQKNYTTKKFVTNKIRYVGKYTLKSFLEIEKRKNSVNFYQHFFQTHLYILNSVSVLSKYNIIHYDLKQNNISIDDNKRIPVIIDFGLSFRYKEDLVTDFDYEQNFYLYYDKYPPWCLDIILISFIVQEFSKVEDLHKTIRANPTKKGKSVSKKRRSTGIWKTAIISTEQLIEIVDHYFKNNYVILEIHAKKIVNESKKKWEDFIKKEFNEKTGEYIVRFLMKSWDTWDNYSICVLYFSLARSFFPKAHMNYQQIMIDNILATPLERDICDSTTLKIKDYIQTLTL
jgi:serine/threonine protein kinase